MEESTQPTSTNVYYPVPLQPSMEEIWTENSRCSPLTPCPLNQSFYLRTEKEIQFPKLCAGLGTLEDGKGSEY